MISEIKLMIFVSNEYMYTFSKYLLKIIQTFIKIQYFFNVMDVESNKN